MTLKGRVVIEEIESEALKGNPAGDPHIRQTPVYLPPGHDANDRQRYPVIYVLHGQGRRGVVYLNHYGWRPSLPERLDDMMSGGRMRETIVVMADGWTKYSHSQWRNSEGTGQYDDYMIHDIVPWIDRRFRTLADRDHRGVTGKSSGGYAAFMLAAEHPDVFGAMG